MDISELLKQEEGLHLEFKASKGSLSDSLFETYSAFANTDGGDIYLGISDATPHKIIGADNPKQQIANFIKAVQNKSKCSCNLISNEDIELIKTGEGSVVRIHVKKAPLAEKPVYINGILDQSYIRLGEADQRMSKNQILSFLEDRELTHMDGKINSLGLGIERLGKGTLRDFRSLLAKGRPNNSLLELGDEQLLERIGALAYDESKGRALTNGAVAFFGQYADICRLFPAFHLDYQRYASGKERWEERIASDDFSFSGNMFDFYTRVMDSLKSRLPNAFRRDADGANDDGSSLYDTVSEALINALTNMSMLMDGGVLVQAYPDRISFRNSGDMLVDKEQAFRGGVSIVRNPAIMTFFRALNLAERSGFGIPTIVSTMRKNKYPDPILEMTSDGRFTKLTLLFTPIASSGSSSERKNKILSCLVLHPEGISVPKLALEINEPLSSVKKDVSELLLLRYIADNGKARKGRLIYLFDHAD